VLEAHLQEVSKIIYLEDRNTMITGSKDRTVKFWKYPVSSDNEYVSNIDTFINPRTSLEGRTLVNNQPDVRKKSEEEAKQEKTPEQTSELEGWNN